MVYKNQVLVFIVSFLIFGLFLLSTAKEGFSGNGGTLGCCHIDSTACVGCVENCAITQDECGDNVFGAGVYCALRDDTQTCVGPDSTEGCCVLSRGNCQNAHTIVTCEGAAGIAWFASTACSEVPQCTPPIPTLNQWGMIITIAVIGLFAVIGLIITRRRNTGTS